MAQANDISIAVFQNSFSLYRVKQLALGDNRDRDRLLHSSGSKELVPLLVVAGSDGLVPGIITAYVYMECSHTGRLVHLSHLQPLSHVVIAGCIAHVVGDAELHDDWEVGTTGLLDLLDNLHGEAHPVLQATTVLISAVVPQCGLELIDQVAAITVELHGVGAGPLRQHGRVAHGFDHVADLLHSEGLTVYALEIEGLRVAGRVGRTGRIGVAHAAQAGSQLDHQLAVMSVDLVHQQIQSIHVGEVVEHIAAAGLKLLGAHEGAGEDGGTAALGPLLKIVDVPLLNATVRVGLVAHGAHDNSVLQSHVADLGSGKQLHKLLLFLSSHAAAESEIIF